MWTRPWKLVEGFAVGAGLVLVGLLLQFSAGPIAWSNLSFPVNFIILAGYILVMALVFAFRNKVYSFKFLSSYASAIPALVYAVALTAIMGLTKQMPDGHPAADPVGTFAHAFVLAFRASLHLDFYDCGSSHHQQGHAF